MRLPRTSDDLRGIAGRIARVADELRAIADRMDRDKLPQFLVHAEDKVNRALPALRKWVATMAIDLDDAIESQKRGVRSRAEINKENAERQRKRRLK